MTRSGQGPTDRRRTDRFRSRVHGPPFTRAWCRGGMPHQLRLMAAVAVVSGLAAAGAVFAEDRFGLVALQQELRRTR